MSNIKKIQNPKSKTQNNKGVSLLFIVLISGIILAIALGICAILIQAMKIMTEIGYSVVAFYAADSGIEAAVYDLYQSVSPHPKHSDQPKSDYYSDNAELGEAHYDTESWCCNPNFGDCSFGGPEEPECPLGTDYIGSDDPSQPKYCDALNYCLKSRGSYQRVKRAIEINY
jgi:hypothetical protein